MCLGVGNILRNLYSLFACLFLATATCAAQGAAQMPETKDQNPNAQPPAAQSAPSASQAPKTQDPPKPVEAPQDKKPPENGTSNDRLFFAIPNFLTLENAGQVPPLTTGQKFSVVLRSSFDPVQIPWYGFLSAVSQAENSEPGYGQGWAAYGKRFGAYAADGTIENFMVGAVLPSLLRQDPRYFQSGKGSFMHRTGYAVSRVLVTRGDSGNQQFNFSEVAGAALASGISTYSYHPGRTLRGYSNTGTPVYWPSDRTLSNSASVWGSQVGYDAITFVVKEFWPDIRRKIKKQR
jgi:hypothetical protein